MKTGFKDPIADVPGKTRKTHWDFRCPQYDQRSSNFVNAGSYHGVGHKNPIGRAGNPKSRVPTLPYGRVNTMRVDDVLMQNLPQEYTE